jgi:hypothetical protein
MILDAGLPDELSGLDSNRCTLTYFCVSGLVIRACVAACKMQMRALAAHASILIDDELTPLAVIRSPCHRSHCIVATIQCDLCSR